MICLRDRRIPDQAAEVVDFETPSFLNIEKSLAELAGMDTQRYPSRTYETWKTWTKQMTTTQHRKTISWANGSVVDANNGSKLLQIEPKKTEASHRLPTTGTTIHDDDASITSTPSRRDSADPQPRHQRSSSLLQNIVLTASDDALMKAVIESDTSLVTELLKQKASELAFDFEWLGELIELGHSVEDIATVLIEEESELPWLLVSGGNFGKRALKMSKRLEWKKTSEGRS